MPGARRFGGAAFTLLDSAADPAFLAAGRAHRLKDSRVIGGVIGGAHLHGLIPEPFSGLPGRKLGLRRLPHEDIVATPGTAEIHLAAQHHGVYAAALAGCPFVTSPSNSQKIEAVIDWTGLPIPVCMRQQQVLGSAHLARALG